MFHEIVHNQHVVQDFIRRGVRFVQSIDEVPKRAKLVLSAHGVSPAVWQQAKDKQVEIVIDATCPLVDKVHRGGAEICGTRILESTLIGHEKHDEIVGTSGEAPERIRIVADITDARAVDIPDPDKVIVLTQTTLSVDDTREVIEVLKERFPRMVTPVKEDICYATQNRQDAVKQLAEEVELILVIGSRNSENSNQLCKVARARGATAYLVDDCHAIDPKWLAGVERVGITSGASAPERLVQETAEFFKQQGAENSFLGFAEENIHFAFPPELAPNPQR